VFSRGGRGVQYRDVAFSPDGALFAAAEEEGAINLRESAGGRLVRRVTDKEEFGIQPHLTFSPDGRLLAGNHNQRLRLWDVATGKELPGLEDVLYFSAGAFSPDGETLATLDGGPTVTLRRTAGKRLASEGVLGDPEKHHSLLSLA